MIQLSDGFLYGTTVGQAGGITGTIYKLSTDGATFQILHTFTETGSVGSPYTSLVQGSDEFGFLYGMTANSGVAAAGTVYKIKPDGTGFIMIHPFTGSATDGGLPAGRLIELSDHNFYGTTQRGGTQDCGTVFRISPTGGYELIDSFAVAAKGCFPNDGVMQATDGNLYGTAPVGGSGFGTVFRVPFSNPGGQAPVITSANSATFIAGVPSSFTVTTTASPTAMVAEAGTLPNGVMFKNGNGTAVLTGTAAAGTGGSYPIVITASNGSYQTPRRISCWPSSRWTKASFWA